MYMLLLAEAESAIDWQHIGGAGFIGVCFLFAPFITKILVAWWNRKRGEEGESDGQKRVVQVIERVVAKVDDAVNRLKEHAEQDKLDAKEIRDELSDARDQLQRIEVELARGKPY